MDNSTDIEGLIAGLEDTARFLANAGHTNAIYCVRAAAALKSQSSAHMKAVEALEPFADFGEFMDSETEGFDDLDQLEVTPEESGIVLTRFYVSHFRRAQAALAHLQDQGGAS